MNSAQVGVALVPNMMHGKSALPSTTTQPPSPPAPDLIPGCSGELNAQNGWGKGQQLGKPMPPLLAHRADPHPLTLRTWRVHRPGLPLNTLMYSLQSQVQQGS